MSSNGVYRPLSFRLMPDELWTEASRLIPPPKTRPQGGGRKRLDDRMALVAIVYVLTMGCAWRRLPDEFNMTVPSVYRRFIFYVEIDLFRQLYEAASQPSLKEWASEIYLAALERARKEL